MASRSPESSQRQALAGFNRDFVTLLCSVPPGQAAFGLDATLLGRLRGLPGPAREALAAAPVLLAGCRGLPPPGPGVAEARPAGLRPGPAPECQIFATALLTWLWQVARADGLTVALHTGPGTDLPDWLRAVAVGDLQAAAAGAPRWLEARFAGNPRLWPDLVRAAASGDPELLTITRLSVVQLTLVAPRAGPKPAAPRPCGGAASP
jgi:hypothetical protein